MPSLAQLRHLGHGRHGGRNVSRPHKVVAALAAVALLARGGAARVLVDRLPARRAMQVEEHAQPAAARVAQHALDVRQVVVGRRHQLKRPPPGGGAVGRVRRLGGLHKVPVAERKPHKVEAKPQHSRPCSRPSQHSGRLRTGADPNPASAAQTMAFLPKSRRSHPREHRVSRLDGICRM